MAILLGSSTLTATVGATAEGSLLFAPNAHAGAAVALAGLSVVAPRLASAVALTSRKIRATFDQPMAKDSALLSIGTYVVFPQEANAVGIFTQGVEAEPITSPNYVDISVSEMTDGKSYALAVNSGDGAPTSARGLLLNPAGDTASFTGRGVKPKIALVKAIGPNRVDVQFSEPMLDTPTIRDVEQYQFDNGLTVTAVLDVVADTVKLVTTNQVPGQIYTLTIG